MKNKQVEWLNQNTRTILFGLLTAIITLIITISYMHLWGTDINVPLTGYRSDSIGVLLEASNYVRGGDVHRNVSYGAPNLNRYISAFGDSSVPMPFIKFLTGISGSVEAAVNIQAILNSVMLACAMYWISCKVKLKEEISLIAGVSFSCLSFFVMACNTLLLIYGFCFYIPLFCYNIIDLMSKPTENNKTSQIGNMVFLIAVMFFVGLNSAYYAFLAMIVLAFAGLYVLVHVKSVDKIMLIVVSYITIGAGIATYLFPNILHNMNQEVFDPIWNSGLYYLICIVVYIVLIGLGILFYKKIYPHVTMKTIWVILGAAVVLVGVAYIVIKKYTNFLGVYDGRTLYAVELGALNIANIALPAINNVFDFVNQELPLLIDLENQDVTALGIITGIGFCYSVMCIFRFDKESSRKDEIVGICGLCNCFMAILAVKGGLASLIATYITTGIRNYNRICIFIAVFSLISFGVLVEKVFDKIKKLSNNGYKSLLYICSLGVILVGMILSCPTDFIIGDSFGLVAYDQRKKEYDDWKQLITDIEETVPEGSMILELPLSKDNIYTGELMEAGRAYELAVPAIISNTTIWSCSGGWRTELKVENDTEQFLEQVCEAGFQGLYIDALLYHDDSYVKQLEALQNYLGEPIVCNDNRRYFFDLSGYMKN